MRQDKATIQQGEPIMTVTITKQDMLNSEIQRMERRIDQLEDKIDEHRNEIRDLEWQIAVMIRSAEKGGE